MNLRLRIPTCKSVLDNGIDQEPYMDLERMQAAENADQVPKFDEKIFIILNNDENDVMYGVVPSKDNEVLEMMLLEDILQQQVAPGG